MNIIRTASTIIMATILISGNAVAEGKKLADKLSNGVIAVSIEVKSCDADAAILCPGLPLNSQKSFMCLIAYEDNLSIACELGIVEAAMTLEMGMIAIDYSIKACEADADKHCLNVEAGEGRIVSCLRKNESKLSNECTSALKETGLWNLGAK
ncbi:MAG: cysteine rich repeat-containing protein [Gammaproteobacteria bacterium]